MVNFNNSLLGTPLAQDPAITLKNYIQTNWDTYSSGVTPPTAAKILFDTKFSRLDKANFVIIEPMPGDTESQVIGNGRYVYDDVRRIQIFCNSKSSYNDRWLMERHITNLINANMLGMQAQGIIWAMIDKFEETRMQPESKTNIPEIESTLIARSWAFILLRYEDIRT